MTYAWLTTPWVFFAVAVATTLTILIADRQVSRRRARRLRRLADRHGFRYSLVDRFQLVRRLSPSLSIDGIAVRDLMYRRDPAGYTYAFTAVYGTRPRVVVVMRAAESTEQPTAGLIDVQSADKRLPLGEQYRRLLNADGS